jgi:hypothetical protein
MNKKQILILLSVFILVSLTTATFVSAPVSIGTLYSYPSPDPTVDGTLDPTEWKEGETMKLTLFNLLNENEKLPVEIMSVWGNDYYLYFGVTIPQKNINGEDYFFIVFEDIEGTPICLPPYNVNGSFSANHDLKMVWLHNNHSVDCFTRDSGYVWTVDTDNGGTDDGIAKCHFNGSHVTIETRYPFDSGDAPGHDFKVAVNDTINIFLWFHDEDSHKDFSQILEYTNDYEFITLEIAHSKTVTTPLYAFYILLGMIGTTVFTLHFRRKK